MFALETLLSRAGEVREGGKARDPELRYVADKAGTSMSFCFRCKALVFAILWLYIRGQILTQREDLGPLGSLL